jgi:hypothetical protein
MQHASARQSIARFMAGSGFGEQGLTVGLAAELLALLPGALGEGLHQAALNLTPEPATPYTGPLNQQPVPGTVQELAAQLVPAVIAHAGDTGLSLALLALLADLWPHVASEERPLLRVRFLNSLCERAASVGSKSGLPREAIVTGAELTVWNRYLPTATGGGGTGELQRLLTAGNAQAAYHLLADHLISGTHPVTIARILGTLALQIADGREDRQGILLGVIAGAVAAERLVALAPPEHYPTLLAQLAHQLWWAANGAELPRRRQDDSSADDLVAAIVAGSASAARRRARSLRHDDQAWWTTLGPVLLGLAGRDPHRVRRAVTAAWVLAVRSANRVVAPDDAAAVVAILADGA